METTSRATGTTEDTTGSAAGSGAGAGLEWSEAAVRVLRERYLKRDAEGRVIETPDEMCWRVARAVAAAETQWTGDAATVEAIAERFYRVMAEHKFLPNSPTLMNAGKGNNLQLSACYVVPVEDSLSGIFDAVKHAALIHQSGGGTGMAFSRLRPKGSIVGSTHGVASGPVSFMKIFDGATEAVKQGGCVVPETRVSTSSGLVPIGTLGPVEAEPKSWHALAKPFAVCTDDGSRKAEEFYHNGLAAVRHVQTTHGYHFTGTLEHRVRVIDEQGEYVWRRLKDLRVGDWVALQKHTYPDSADFRFAPFDHTPHFNATQITTPERPSAELGEFIGYLIGDGCINYYNPGGGTGRLILTVADAEPEVGERLLKLADELFGVTPLPRKKPNDASTNYFFASTELVAWLKHIGVTKPSTLDAHVPEVVFQAGAEFARGFVRGLFTADGAISKEGYPQLYSISNGLVQDVQQLLLALGIPTSISVNANRESALGKNPIYRLRIITREGMREFAERIGFMSAAKNDRLDAGLEKAWEFNDVIPNQQQQIAALYDGPGRGSGPNRGSRGADRELYRDILHYLPNVAAPRQLTRSRLRALAEKHEEVRTSPLAGFLTNEQFYDRVASIEDDEAVTVDLSVEGNHTYIANGFVSHNTRRGANMGVLRVDHPDILEFIDCKRDGSVTNFNISVAITDEFMRALESDAEYDLVDPYTQQAVKRLRARDVMDRIVAAAWATGDPGLLFLDRANHSPANPVPEVELLEATNPCGEQWLGPYDACNLGSINLGLFVTRDAAGRAADVDWAALEEATRLCTRFLDDVIDINPYPLSEVRDKVHANRRIGLGVMGWAELLFELGLRYDSEAATQLGERVMGAIRDWSRDESERLAETRGPFPNWPRSIYKHDRLLRNATRTTVAPTGSISILAECSSGIEPIFALAFQHRVKQPDGSYRVLDFVNPFFERALAASDIADKGAALAYVKEHGSLHGHPAAEHPPLRPYVTAHEIAPDWHIRMQAAFQKGVNNSISKTINLANSATYDDVRHAYLLAWELGCLGITIFRDGCKGEQVLNLGVKNAAKQAESATGPTPMADTAADTAIATEMDEDTDGERTMVMPAIRYQRGVKERPEVVTGYTRQVRAPEGKVNVTLNADAGGLLEVFVNVGKAGSDVSALAEALGRLMSLILQLDSSLSQDDRAREIARQLRSIGGSNSIGFGPERVRSLPDAVARAIERHFSEGYAVGAQALPAVGPEATPRVGNGGSGAHEANGAGNHNPAINPLNMRHYAVTGNLCPQCGNNTMRYEEGCRKCVSCGHSEC